MNWTRIPVTAALVFLAWVFVPRPVAAAPFQGGDECFFPQFVGASASISFDLTTATTSVGVPYSSMCDGPLGPTMEHDRWFGFFALSDMMELQVCGTTTVDLKAAVYDVPLGGCPTQPAIACASDICGAQPRMCFRTTIGVPYVLQLGVPPGAAPGTGTFALQNVGFAPTVYDRHDDGSSETSNGLNAGGTFAWLQRFYTILPDTNGVRAILVAYGTPAFPGTCPPNGTPAEVAVWEDPNNDGDPADAVLVTRVPTTIQSGSTDTFVRVPLPETANVLGYYFVGVVVTHAAGQFPAALDRTSCPTNSGGRAWFAGAPTGPFDFDNLSANAIPPTDVDTVGFPGVWLLRVDPGTIAAGSNLYVTPPGTTFADFTSPLPAGFFGPGSQPFASRVVFAGQPLSGTGSLLGADTIVERLEPATFPLCGYVATVHVRLLALSLVGSLPISFGTSTSTYRLNLTTTAGPQPSGTCPISRSRPNGGTLSWSIPFTSRLEFTRIAGTSGLPSVVVDPGPTVTLTANAVHWSFTDEGLGLAVSAGGTVDNDGVPGTPDVPFPASGGLFVGVWRPGPSCSSPTGPPQLDESYEQANDFQHGLLPAGSAVLGGNFGYGFGHSTMTPCPCGNASQPGENAGCANSLGTGARLSLAGLASVSSDDLVLLGSGMPNSSALYFQGTFHASAGAAFGDGRRVATGTVIRLGTRTNVAGSSQYPSPGDPSISVRGAIPPFGGVTRNYQVWYRNAATFCTSSTFNLSNGYQVAWQF